MIEVLSEQQQTNLTNRIIEIWQKENFSLGSCYSNDVNIFCCICVHLCLNFMQINCTESLRKTYLILKFHGILTIQMKPTQILLTLSLSQLGHTEVTEHHHHGEPIDGGHAQSVVRPSFFVTGCSSEFRLLTLTVPFSSRSALTLFPLPPHFR